MNALPSPRSSSRPIALQQRAVRPTRRVAQSRQNLVGVEVAVKLGVNVTMLIVAISALARLIPYNVAQSERLDELRTEVQSTQGRVDALQANLEQNFDPQRSRQVMQEQSHLLEPNQKQVIWLRPIPLDSQL